MMGKERLEQLVPLAGIAFVVLFVVGSILALSINEWLPATDDIVASFSDTTDHILGTYLGLLGAFFLMWFAGSVRSALREHEDGSGRLSAVSFGGGVASAIVVALSFLVLRMGHARAGANGGISAAGATTLYDLGSGLTGVVLPVTLAVFVGAAAIVSLRTAVFPTWFAWFGAVAALASLSPVGYIGQILAIVWVVVVSVWLTARGVSQQSAVE